MSLPLRSHAVCRTHRHAGKLLLCCMPFLFLLLTVGGESIGHERAGDSAGRQDTHDHASHAGHSHGGQTYEYQGQQFKIGPFAHLPRSVTSRDIDQQHLKLELGFDFAKLEVQGRATLTVKPLRTIGELVLDAAMKIDDVSVAGDDGRPSARKLEYRKRGNRLEIVLDRPYQAGEKLTVSIGYRLIRPQRGVYFVTPDAFEPKAPTMVWTHCEPEEARTWFPSFDSPTDRLTSETVVTVPGEMMVISNGVLKKQVKNKDGTQTWSWSQEQSHVTYLISVVAGKFDKLEQSWDGIPIVSYVPVGRKADAARSFEKTAKMVEYFSRKIGYRYPWPKYSQVCVDRYIAGGMEHTSASTLTLATLHDERAHLDISSDNLVAHELAHQWWGDLITCKDWGELWLNESFATYFATLWQEHDLGWDEAAWQRWGEAEAYFQEDANRYRRPIVTYRYDAPHVMFDSHSYPKGARVLHMLRFVLGDEMYWKVIQQYTKSNAFDVVETADLRRAIERVSGQGLNWFFDQWTENGGHPEFHVVPVWDNTAKTLRVTVRQLQTVDARTPLFRTPVEIELALPDQTLVKRIEVSKAEETFHFQLAARPRWVNFDPKDWILKKLETDQAKEDWIDQLRHSNSMIGRVRAALALGKMPTDEDAREALIKSLRTDDFWAVRHTAASMLANFKGQETRQALLRAAKEDDKSHVRRTAVQSLAKHPHADTAKALRAVIADDRSYYAVADALRALVEIDRANCKSDLLAALKRSSHREVIIAAACDGLAKLNDSSTIPAIAALLEAPASPERRAGALGALAKLSPKDTKVTEAIAKQLETPHRGLRQAAVSALAELDDPAAAEILTRARAQEQMFFMDRVYSEALSRLADRTRGVDRLQKEVEALRGKNLDLEKRIERLEELLKRL